MSENVLIIGSGIAGMLSAMKIKESGYSDSITICERNSEIEKPPTAAAFYCHEFLTKEITPTSFEVKWKIIGDKKNASRLYALKVYGPAFSDKVSICEKEAKGWAIDTEYLIDQTSDMVETNRDLTSINLDYRYCEFNDYERVYYDTLISTIPMPIFLKICNKKSPTFISKPIYVTERDCANMGMNTMSLLYYTDPKYIYYRGTEWNGKRFLESMEPTKNCSAMYPGKIWGCDKSEEIIKDFRKYAVYFQGRYARWERKYFVSNVWNNILEEIYE